MASDFADSKPAGIEGGTFEKGMKLENFGSSITIKDGLFDGKVSAAEGYSGMLSISGGYFVNKPTLPEGSDIAFTSVSDQAGRTFQVPVNGSFSENGYETLYVPSGSSEQPNTITVKTAAPLTDCLADDVSIMDSVQANADGSYAIDVHSPASIVLVTAEPAPGEPGGELDPGLSSGAAARQPSRSAAAALCAGVLHETATRSPVTCRAAAAASAPPIFPAPRNPASYLLMVFPPQRICPSPRMIYL